MSTPAVPPPASPRDGPALPRERWIDVATQPLLEHLGPMAHGRSEFRVLLLSVLLAALTELAPAAHELGTGRPETRHALAALFVVSGVLAWLGRHRRASLQWAGSTALLLGFSVLWATQGAAWGFGYTAFVVGTLGFSERRRNGRVRLPIEENDPLPPQRTGLPGFVSGLALTLAAVLVVRQFALEARNVPTGSMQPTIMGNREHASGDHVLVNRVDYQLRDPRRWEIAVFDYPLLPQVTFVKRVVGLPGETVEIRDGDIWVDGEIASKPSLVQEGLWQEVYPRPNPLARPKTVQVFRLSEDDGWRKHGDGLRIAKGRRGGMATYAAGRRRLGTHDFRLTLDVDPEIVPGEMGEVHLEIESHGHPVSLRLPFGDVSATDLAGLTCKDGEQESLEWRLTGPATVQLAVVDGVASAHVDGRLLARIPVPTDGRGQPEIRFGAEGSVRFPRIRIERDIVYASNGTTQFVVPEDAFVVLGDNTRASHDSRLWRARAYHVRGREAPIVAAITAPDPATGKDAPNVRRSEGRYSLVDVDGVQHSFAIADVAKTEDVGLPFVRRRHLIGRAALIHWPWGVHEAGFRPRILP